MSEKRFELYSDDYFFGAYDNVTQEKINVLKSIDLLNSFVEENEQLRKQCFELEKDYVIETSDISDRIYLDDEIRELKQKYGV